MNTFLKTIASFCSALVLTSVTLAAAEGTRLTIIEEYDSLGFLKPVPINLSGFTGEVDAVLKNDLIFMGFTHVPADQAQILVAGNNNARVEARVSDRLSKNQYLAKAYTGNTLRAQAHALADDIATTLTRLPGIAQSKIAFKAQRGAVREIYIADYDGHNPQAVTTSSSRTAWPTSCSIRS